MGRVVRTDAVLTTLADSASRIGGICMSGGLLAVTLAIATPSLVDQKLTTLLFAFFPLVVYGPPMLALLARANTYVRQTRMISNDILQGVTSFTVLIVLWELVFLPVFQLHSSFWIAGTVLTGIVFVAAWWILTYDTPISFADAMLAESPDGRIVVYFDMDAYHSHKARLERAPTHNDT